MNPNGWPMMASEKIGPDNAIRNGGKDDQWLECMLELREQGQINGDITQMTSTVVRSRKAADLLFLLACEAEDEPVGKLLLELFQLWHSRCDDFRRQMSLARPALHGNGPVLIEASDFRRYRTPGKSSPPDREAREARPAARRRIGCEIGELGSLLHAHASNNRNLLVAISQDSSRNAMKSSVDGIGDICVCDVRQVCPVRIDVDHFSRTRLAPIISNSGGDGDIAKDLLQLLGFRSEAGQIFAGNSDLDRYSNRLARFEGPRIYDCARNLPVKFRLQQGQAEGSYHDCLWFAELPAHSWFAGPQVWRCSRSADRRRPQSVVIDCRHILRMSMLRMASCHTLPLPGG